MLPVIDLKALDVTYDYRGSSYIWMAWCGLVSFLGLTVPLMASGLINPRVNPRSIAQYELPRPISFVVLAVFVLSGVFFCARLLAEYYNSAMIFRNGKVAFYDVFGQLDDESSYEDLVGYHVYEYRKVLGFIPVINLNGHWVRVDTRTGSYYVSGLIGRDGLPPVTRMLDGILLAAKTSAE